MPIPQWEWTKQLLRQLGYQDEDIESLSSPLDAHRLLTGEISLPSGGAGHSTSNPDVQSIITEYTESGVTSGELTNILSRYGPPEHMTGEEAAFYLGEHFQRSGGAPPPRYPHTAIEHQGKLPAPLEAYRIPGITWPDWMRTQGGAQLQEQTSRFLAPGDQPGLPREETPRPHEWEEGYISREQAREFWPADIYLKTWQGVPGTDPNSILVSQDPTTTKGLLKLGKRTQQFRGAYQTHEMFSPQGDPLTTDAPLKVSPESTRHERGVVTPMVYLLDELLPEGMMGVPKGMFGYSAARRVRHSPFFAEGEEPKEFAEIGTTWTPGQKVVPFEGASPMFPGLGKSSDAIRLLDVRRIAETQKDDEGREIAGARYRMIFESAATPEAMRLAVSTGPHKFTAMQWDTEAVHDMPGYGISTIKDPAGLPFIYWQAHPEEAAQALGMSSSEYQSKSWQEVGNRLTDVFREEILPEIYEEKPLNFQVHQSQLEMFPEEKLGTVSPIEDREEWFDVTTKPVGMLKSDWFVQYTSSHGTRKRNLPYRELQALRGQYPRFYERLMRETEPTRRAYAGMIGAVLHNAGNYEMPQGVMSPTPASIQGVVARAEEMAMAATGKESVEGLSPWTLERFVLQEAAEEYGTSPLSLGSVVSASPSHIKRFSEEGFLEYEEVSRIGRAFSRALISMGGPVEQRREALANFKEAQEEIAVSRNFTQMALRAHTRRSVSDQLLMDPAMPATTISAPEESVLSAYGLKPDSEDYDDMVKAAKFVENWKSGAITPKAFVFGHPTPGSQVFGGTVDIVHPDVAKEMGVKFEAGKRFVANPLLMQALGRDADKDLGWALAVGGVGENWGGQLTIRGLQEFNELTEDDIRAQAEAAVRAGRASLVRTEGVGKLEDLQAALSQENLHPVGSDEMREAMVQRSRYAGIIGQYYNILEDVEDVARGMGVGEAAEQFKLQVHGRTQGWVQLPLDLYEGMKILSSLTPKGGVRDPLAGEKGEWDYAMGRGLSVAQRRLFQHLAGGESLDPTTVAELMFPGTTKEQASGVIERYRAAESGIDRSKVTGEAYSLMGDPEQWAADTPLGGVASAHLLRRSDWDAEKLGIQSQELSALAKTRGEQFQARRTMLSKAERLANIEGLEEKVSAMEVMGVNEFRDLLPSQRERAIVEAEKSPIEYAKSLLSQGKLAGVPVSITGGGEGIESSSGRRVGAMARKDEIFLDPEYMLKSWEKSNHFTTAAVKGVVGLEGLIETPEAALQFVLGHEYAHTQGVRGKKRYKQGDEEHLGENYANMVGLLYAGVPKERVLPRYALQELPQEVESIWGQLQGEEVPPQRDATTTDIDTEAEQRLEQLLAGGSMETAVSTAQKVRSGGQPSPFRQTLNQFIADRGPKAQQAWRKAVEQRGLNMQTDPSGALYHDYAGFSGSGGSGEGGGHSNSGVFTPPPPGDDRDGDVSTDPGVPVARPGADASTLILESIMGVRPNEMMEATKNLQQYLPVWAEQETPSPRFTNWLLKQRSLIERGQGQYAMRPYLTDKQQRAIGAAEELTMTDEWRNLGEVGQEMEAQKIAGYIAEGNSTLPERLQSKGRPSHREILEGVHSGELSLKQGIGFLHKWARNPDLTTREPTQGEIAELQAVSSLRGIYSQEKVFEIAQSAKEESVPRVLLERLEALAGSTEKLTRHFDETTGTVKGLKKTVATINDLIDRGRTSGSEWNKAVADFALEKRTEQGVSRILSQGQREGWSPDRIQAEAGILLSGLEDADSASGLQKTFGALKKLMTGWTPMQMRRVWGMTGAPVFNQLIPAAAQAEMTSWQASQAFGGADGGLPDGLAGDLMRANRGQGTIDAGRIGYRAWGWTQQPAIRTAVNFARGIAGPAVGRGLMSAIGLNALGSLSIAGTTAGALAAPVGLGIAAIGTAIGAGKYIQSYGEATPENQLALAESGLWSRLRATAGRAIEEGNIGGWKFVPGIGPAAQAVSNISALPEAWQWSEKQQTAGEYIRGTALSDLSGKQRMSALSYVAQQLGEQENTIWAGMNEGQITQAIAGFAPYTDLDQMTPEQMATDLPDWIQRAVSAGVNPAQYQQLAQSLGMGTGGVEQIIQAMVKPGIGSRQQRQMQAVLGQYSPLSRIGFSGQEILGNVASGRWGELTNTQSINLQRIVSGDQTLWSQLARLGQAPAWTMTKDEYGLAIGTRSFGDLNASMVSRVDEGFAANPFLATRGAAAWAMMPEALVDADRGTVSLFDGSQATIGVGGMWGLQDWASQENRAYQDWQMDQQGIGLQQQRSHQYAVWGIQDQLRDQQRAYQRAMFGIQGERLDLQGEQMRTQHGWQFTDIQKNYQRGLVRLGWTEDQMDLGQDRRLTQLRWQEEALGRNWLRTQTQWGWQDEDFSLQQGLNRMQFGWQMEDFDENIRFATGRQRTQLMRQRERAVTMQNVQEGQASTELDRLEERRQWAKEDHQTALEQLREKRSWLDQDHTTEKDRLEQRRKWLEEDHAKALDRHSVQKQWAEESFELSQRQHETTVGNFEAQAQLQDKLTAAQRAYWEQQHQRQAEALQNAKEHRDVVRQIEDIQKEVSRQQQIVFQQYKEAFEPDGEVYEALHALSDELEDVLSDHRR